MYNPIRSMIKIEEKNFQQKLKLRGKKFSMRHYSTITLFDKGSLQETCLGVYWEGILAPKINHFVCSHNLLRTGSRESPNRKCFGDKSLPPGEILGVEGEDWDHNPVVKEQCLLTNKVLRLLSLPGFIYWWDKKFSVFCDSIYNCVFVFAFQS